MSAETIFQNEWVAIKKTPRDFYYLERKGQDSVAVLLLRRWGHKTPSYEVLIRQQPLCIDETGLHEELPLHPCPITGGIEAGETPDAAVIREVYEEAGYRVQPKLLGDYIVGTQTNERCYLYFADVTGLEAEVAQQDGSYFEAISQNEWHPLDYLKQCDYIACQLGYFKLQDILFA